MRYAYVLIAYDKVFRVFSSLKKARECLDEFFRTEKNQYWLYDKDHMTIRYGDDGRWIAYISTQNIY